FFSSRRRHTRSDRDWSSDVCSSDLKLRKKYSGAHLFLLIGDDNLAGLPNWRGFEDLRHIVTFIVLQRAFTPVAHEYLSVDRRIEIGRASCREREEAREGSGAGQTTV